MKSLRKLGDTNQLDIVQSDHIILFPSLFLLNIVMTVPALLTKLFLIPFVWVNSVPMNGVSGGVSQ